MKHLKVCIDSQQFKRWLEQFKWMRQCVRQYGNYPYPKYLVLPEKKLVYLEMPKVANTSIKAGILGKKFADTLSAQKESLLYTHHELQGRFRRYYKFTFVRNPFERVVSCYENKYHEGRKDIGNGVEELEYDNYLFGYIKKDRGFASFLCRIALIPDCYKDHHFKPQCKIVCDEKGKKRVDYVGRYEKLKEEYEKIAKKYDLGELEVYNKTERKYYMDYYNWFTARLAYLIYRKDIQYFGYEDEYQKLLRYVRRRGRDD